MAQDCLKQGNSRDFYNEISKALLGFVSDKYNIPKVDLTKDNVRQQLAAQQIAPEKIDSLVAVLQTCEMAVFGGMTNEESMEKVYKESEELIHILVES